MGANILSLCLSLAVLQSLPPDTTSPYTSPAVQQLVERAMARRRAGDSLVTDYRARLRYRLTLGVGRRRWAEVPASAVEEQVAQVQWQEPNDLRVDMIGRRSRSRGSAFRLSSVWDRPWFVPREVDDSVRIFSDEFPATGALHPLARTGPDWYRYRLTGGLSVAPGGGGALRLLRVEVRPRRTGPALVAGQMWIDSATAQVVRLTFRYVGTALWVRPERARPADSASAGRLNALANRIVSIDADLEYGLQDGKFWMPRRQVVAGRVRIPAVTDLVIPFQATTTFEDYEINTGRPIAFRIVLPDSGVGAVEGPDSLRAWDYADRWSGGRYELHRPSDAVLDRYPDWPDSLSLDADPADARRVREAEIQLADLTQELPDSLTGERAHGIAYERLTDALRYDRVQGLSLGLGYQVRVPGVRFTGLYGTVRYGLSDDRVTGRLTLLRDAPGGRLVVSGYREIGDLDPFAHGHGTGNTVNALFAAHDNGDYSLVQGGSLGFETSLDVGLDLDVGVRVERETSVGRKAKSAVNDFLGGSGLFPPNPAVDQGTFGSLRARLTGVGAIRWNLAADVIGGEGRSTGRLYGELRRSMGGRRGATLAVKAGVATRPAMQQALFRLGGLATVRGFDYGERRGSAFWSAQLDVAPVKGRLRPVAFLDAGQAASAADLFSSRVLVGGGLGLSVFNGVVRFDLSHPISHDTHRKVRFDLVVRAPR